MIRSRRPPVGRRPKRLEARAERAVWNRANATCPKVDYLFASQLVCPFQSNSLASFFEPRSRPNFWIRRRAPLSGRKLIPLHGASWRDKAKQAGEQTNKQTSERTESSEHNWSARIVVSARATCWPCLFACSPREFLARSLFVLPGLLAARKVASNFGRI